MLNNWKELEDFTKELLKFDGSVKPAGSGSAKKEEDVASKNFVAQCKFTENKSISILEKDLERLLIASKIISKIPLFISSNTKNTLLTLMLEKNNLESISDYLSLIAIENTVNNLEMILKIEYLDESSVYAADNALYKQKQILDHIYNKLNRRISKLDDIVKAKYDHLLQCDLFEGEVNGSK